jgi:replicative DNA helicase
MAEYNKNDAKGLSNLRSVKKATEDSTPPMYGKLPPQAVDLEEAILGAIMLDKDAFAIVLDILRPDSFYKDAHQKIYQAMRGLFEISYPIDLLTVTEGLRKQGDLEAVGGPHYIVELTRKVASAANIEYHARIVAQKYIQRELIRISTKVIKNAYEDTTDVFELLDSAEQGLFEITQNNLNSSYESMGSLASKFIKSLEDLKKQEAGLTGIPTGFKEVDNLTSGFQRSDLIIIAARPGMGKCLGKGTKVLMYSGQLKQVEDIRIGDLLMGVDSTPRKVLSLVRGREQMYWVRQNKGIDYRVNESHILSLKRSRNEGKHTQGDVLNINILDYLNTTTKFKSNYKGYKVAVEFQERSCSLPPYFLGLWLSDGTSSKNQIANRDEEVVPYLVQHADELSLPLKKYHENHAKRPVYSITEGRRNTSFSIRQELVKLNVLNNKHIPENYLLNTTNNRLALLAGLLDSDGHYLLQSNGYEITQKNQYLAAQIKFLCDTLGFRTSLTPKKASIKSIGFETTVYQIRIYGDIDKIPVKIERKQGNKWLSPVDWQVTGITVEKDIIDDYYGFEIDGDQLFLLEDMTVTHNTSFILSLARNAAAMYEKPIAIFSLEMSNLQLVQRLISLETEISAHKLRSGQLEDYEWKQLSMAIEQMSEVPIFIDDTPSISIFELRAKCRRLKKLHNIEMVIIDYLQLMTGNSDGNRGGNREQEVSGISRSLKALAKELNVPVIALSQLSRAVEVRGGTKRPQLSDLRESGCLTGDALLIHAETGARMAIEQLANRKEQTPIPVLAMNEDYTISKHTLSKAFFSGEKEVFELTTRSGRTIKASANHPFRTLSGWTPLEHLQVKNRIAIARKITVEAPKNSLKEDELVLLAHLIGDGCILPKQPYHYTSADMENIKIVNQKAEVLFNISANIVEQKNWWHTYLKSPYHLTHGKQHPITIWYEKLGISRERSYNKEIPEGVFLSDEQHIAIFLKHLWATDGNIGWKILSNRKPASAIYYASSSLKLAQQVQHLLLRLGINSTIRTVSQGKHRDNYHVAIQGKEQQLIFLDKVGCYGKRGNVIQDMKESFTDIQANPNYDTIPQECWDLMVKPTLKNKGVSQAQFVEMLEIAKSSATYKTAISRKRLTKVASVLQDQSLETLANSDVYWDEIVSIKSLGVQKVYDATVEGVHNFLANDIIVHNSIEQDADMVSFIYRPEYYQITEDENGDSLKGVAEIIFAKNRHGATKTVRLKFTEQFAKFSDLDDFSLDDLGSATYESNVIKLPSKMNDTDDIPF